MVAPKPAGPKPLRVSGWAVKEVEQVQKDRGLRKTREGIVVSDAMDKTVIVSTTRMVAHPLYGRIVKRTKKFVAHDEENKCSVGDRVRIMETRPLSRTKRWRVVEILEKAK